MIFNNVPIGQNCGNVDTRNVFTIVNLNIITDLGNYVWINVGKKY